MSKLGLPVPKSVVEKKKGQLAQSAFAVKAQPAPVQAKVGVKAAQKAAGKLKEQLDQEQVRQLALGRTQEGSEETPGDQSGNDDRAQLHQFGSEAKPAKMDSDSHLED
jgi:hypothetical protein